MARNSRTVPPRQPPEPPADVKQALEQADRILDAIEEDLPERAWDRAASFFEDVQAKVKDVRATVERLQRVSGKQLAALNNWEAAVQKWIDPNG